MKKVFLLLSVVCLILVLSFVSCGGSPNYGSSYSSRINVYTSGTDKSLSGLTKTAFPVNHAVIDNDFRRMEKQFAGRTILGLEFVNVVSIEGQFVTSSANSSLTDLIFPSCLQSIGEHVFETSYYLESVIFNGENAPAVDTTAFPNPFVSDCYFTVPTRSRDAYRATGCLEPWLGTDTHGYLNVKTSITLNGINTAYGSKIGSPAITTPTYTVITNTPAPTELCTPTNAGWTFGGWYIDSDAVATSLTDSEGKVNYSVTSYTDNSGNWLYEDECTVYANWTEHSYTIKFDKNYTSATGTTSDTKLTYSQEYTLTDKSEDFVRKGYHIIKWMTTETDETSSTTYEVGQSVSGLVAEDEGEITLYAVWEPKDNLTYTIQYYLETTATGSYELDPSLTDAMHTGKVDTTATAVAIDIDGFTYNAALSTPSDLIAGDESTILYMYYDRKRYAITWKINSNETSVTNVLFGEVPTYTDLPVKPDTAEWHYEFDRWDPDVGAVEGKTEYTAQYGSVKQKYTVYIVTSPSDSSWGTVDMTSVSDVTYGTVLRTSGTQLVVEQRDSQGESVESTVYVTPAVASTTTDYTYVFDSWDNVITVTADTTVTALFDCYDNQRMQEVIQSDCTVDILYSYMLGDILKYADAIPDSHIGISVRYGDTKLTLGTPAVLEGYKLEGFYIEPSCSAVSEIADKDGNLLLNVSGYTDSSGWACTVLNRAVTLYAKWELN